MTGATAAALVSRRWNSPKKSLRRNNLQSIDVRDFFPLTSIWHKRCSKQGRIAARSGVQKGTGACGMRGCPELPAPEENFREPHGHASVVTG
jgi:hypothetical protein